MQISITKNDGTVDYIAVDETVMPAEEIAVAIEQTLQNMGFGYCEECDNHSLNWSADNDMCIPCAKEHGLVQG